MSLARARNVPRPLFYLFLFMPFSTTIQTFHAASCFASGGPFVHRKIIYRYFSFLSLTYSCGFSRVRVDHISELTGCAYLQTHLRTRVHNESTWNTRACNPFPDSFLYASVALINIPTHPSAYLSACQSCEQAALFLHRISVSLFRRKSAHHLHYRSSERTGP